MDLSEISDNQNRHPWELSRTRCILRVLRDIGIKGNILDIGCGDSYFDKRLAEKFLDVEVYGVDIFLEKEMHEGRVHAVNSLERLPIDKFDYILMMDVIEHIEDDVAYLANILKYLKEGGKVIITVPKSNYSARVIPLNEYLLALCHKFLSHNPQAYFLTGSETKFTEPRTLQYKFKKYCKDCQLDNVHFHTLRHTFATRCVEAGFEIKSLSEILGHSTPKITLERYVHSSLELKRINMNKLNTVFF